MDKIVIFDFGNVIAKFNPKMFSENIAPFSAYTPGTIRRLLRENKHIIQSFETGFCTSGEFYKRMAKILELRREEINISLMRTAFTDKFDFIPGTIDLINHLAKNRVKLGMATDTNPWDFGAIIASCPFYGKFQYVAKSFDSDIEVFKTDPRMLKVLLQKKKTKKDDRVVFIDDKKRHVKVAQSLDLCGIVFESPTQVANELKELGFIETIPESLQAVVQPELALT